MLISFICFLLNGKKLKTEHRQRLITQLLKSVDALPLHAIITTNEGKLFIRGKPLDVEQSIALQHSADIAINNQALQFVHEQVLYQAVSLGVHQAQSPEQIQFAKAAIWYGQEEAKLLSKLASGNTTELLG